MMRRALLFTALLLAACGRGATTTSVPATGIPSRVTARFPSSWRFEAGKPPIRAKSAMIASDERLASEAGLEILRNGGNAVDAAVAVGFALAVTYQEAGNIGGGGFMVIRMVDGETAAIDYREMAPLAATRNMYLDASGKLTDKSVDGHLASGVPGSVAGMSAVLEKFGTMKLAEVMAPAIRLAEEGFIVEPGFNRSVRGDSARIARYGGRAFLPNGAPPAIGSRFRQPDLARTLRLIAAGGPDAFYKGEIADSLVAEMQRGGGIITKKDLANYRPRWRDPIRSTYRGYALFTMPPASSGGIVITETLNILETYPTLPPFGSAAYAHILGSAYQRAFIDRNAKIADPAFVKVPLGELTSKKYARKLRATIEDRRATATRALEAKMGARIEGTETTHYSVVDAMGNAVATTTTTNGLYGSGVLVRGAGFFMNNEMDDLSAQPGKPNQFGLVQGEANAVAPGKRPLSAMSPTIVLDPAGELLLVLGARGGPRIITATSQVIINVIDHRMSIADAMSAPRIHHQALPDSLMYERGGLSQATLDSLTKMGHGPMAVNSVALANAIMRVKGEFHAVGDPRRPGGVVGY
jgi:gamma-glutamyltranspeptidase/glutathione hydrolase